MIAALSAPLAVAAGPELVLRLSALDLAPLPGAVPCARLHVRHVLRTWDLPALADDAEVVVAELVTNAVRHAGQIAGRDGCVLPVRLRLRPGSVRAEVRDASGTMPVPGPADPHDNESGRGLVLVAALAVRYGAYLTEGGGKCVFAVLGT